jgi:lysophospholipase L1-like esterase
MGQEPRKNLVVFLGDSITQGWGSDRLFVEHPEFTNRGIGGQTAGQMLLRFQTDVIALKPAVVHIMAGTNDVAENSGPETDDDIKKAFRSMVDLAVENNIEVLLAAIPPAKKFPWRPALEPAARIKDLNEWLRMYAASRHIAFVDYWTALAGSDGGMKPEYSGDGVHPNQAGYAVMEALLNEALDGDHQFRATP